MPVSAAGVWRVRGLRGDCWVSLRSSDRAADPGLARGGGAPVEISSDGPDT